MRISTYIQLNEAEIKEAILAHIQKSFTIADEKEVSIRIYEDHDSEEYHVSVTINGENLDKAPDEEPEKKTRRRRKKAKETDTGADFEADIEASSDDSSDDNSDDEDEPEESQDEETAAEAEDPNKDLDVFKSQDPVEDTKTIVLQNEQPQIFSNAESSAPNMPPPPQEPSPKSLFANLTKPS